MPLQESTPPRRRGPDKDAVKAAPAGNPRQPDLFPPPPPGENCPKCSRPLAVETWGDRRCLWCGRSFIVGGDGVLRAVADVVGGRRR